MGIQVGLRIYLRASTRHKLNHRLVDLIFIDGNCCSCNVPSFLEVINDLSIRLTFLALSKYQTFSSPGDLHFQESKGVKAI